MDDETVIRPSEDTVKQFQIYLRKYENDDKLVVLEVVEKLATKPGDNYLSHMIRTKLIGTRGDGSPYTKSFMTKIIRNSKMCTILDLPCIFRTEAYVYLDVLPILGSFGPQFVHGDKDVIIMEDLTERGYTTCERRNHLDLDHTIFTLKKLAKLHASALIIKVNDPQQFNTLCMPLQEIIYKDDSETSEIRSSYEDIMKTTLQYLDLIEPQTQESQTIRDHVATCSDKMFDTVYRLFNAPKQKYNTICHGDPWINNLLFLYDKDGKITDLKMIDYQMIRHTSVSTDILYFIYSSVQSSLIERSFGSLLKIYHNEFINELRQLHVDEKILDELGMEWLEKELRTYAFYGLITGCAFVSVILADEKDALQLENANFSEMNPQTSMNSEVKQKKLDRTKCVVYSYYRRLHLGIINEDTEPISIIE